MKQEGGGQAGQAARELPYEARVEARQHDAAWRERVAREQIDHTAHEIAPALDVGFDLHVHQLIVRGGPVEHIRQQRDALALTDVCAPGVVPG